MALPVAAPARTRGRRSTLLLTGLWMALGTLAVYLTARDLGGPVVGALALAGLSLSALQVWFGRYPTSEALTQFLLWAGIWSAGRWLEERRPAALWAFVAGCAFGAVFLVRIDSLVLPAGVRRGAGLALGCGAGSGSIAGSPSRSWLW